MKIRGYTGRLIDPKCSIEIARSVQVAEFRFFFIDVYIVWGEGEKRCFDYKYKGTEGEQ